MRRFALLLLTLALAAGLILLFQSLSTSKGPRAVEDVVVQVRKPAAPRPKTELAEPETVEVTESPTPKVEISEDSKSQPKSLPTKEEPVELKRVRFRARVMGPDYLAKAVAAIEFRVPGQEDAKPIYGEKLTDDYGVYEEELSFGDVEVRALPPRWEPKLGPSHWRSVKVTGQEEVDVGDLVLTFPLGATATGRVLDSEGLPVASIEVVLHWREDKLRDVATWTNEKGRYSFSGLEFGKYRIGLTKGAEEKTADRCFLVRRANLPWFVVDSATGPMVELRDTELRLGGARHHFYFHPPPDALVSTVNAFVRRGGEHQGSGGWKPLEVDRNGIAEWHPKRVDGLSAKHRIEVVFRRSTGEDRFGADVEVEPGKTQRFLIP